MPAATWHRVLRIVSAMTTPHSVKALGNFIYSTENQIFKDDPRTTSITARNMARSRFRGDHQTAFNFHATTSNRREKWSKGFVLGNFNPKGSVIVLISISASAGCKGQ